MTFRLPRLPRALAIVGRDGTPSIEFQRWWQSVVEALEVQEATQDGILDEISDILGLTSDLEAAVEVVEDAAADAQAAADAAQADATAAQAAVDAIVVPPTGSRTVTGNASLTQDDYAILADASGGAITLTLPPAISALNSIIVTKTDGSANAVDTVPDTGDSLNGGVGAVSISTAGGQRIFNSDGTSDWYG